MLRWAVFYLYTIIPRRIIYVNFKFTFNQWNIGFISKLICAFCKFLVTRN